MTAAAAPDRCARCGAPFRCGMQAGEAHCWCADLPAIAPKLGRDCLCRACLEREIAAQRAAQAT
jgi:hypothetical protein